MLCAFPVYAESAVVTKGMTAEQSAAADRAATAASGTTWSGWKQVGQVWKWYQEDGTELKNAVTPDGYYVNENGAWFRSSQNFEQETFDLPERFRTSTSVASMNAFLSDLNRLNKRVQNVLNGKRIFHVYPNRVTYSHLDGSSESLLLSLSRDTSCDGWTLRVSCNLGNRHDSHQSASVDFSVLRILVGRFSHTPDQIADAIYESWQGNNIWNITDSADALVGDALIRCSVENGAAVYKIQRRKDGDL
jgi:hypothetical protein